MRTSSIVIARSDVVVIEHAVVVFLRAGDELSPNALAVIDQKLTEQPGIDFIYGDSSHGRPSRFEEVTNVRRPGWSPERLRGHCYVGDVVLASTDLVARVGGADALCSLSSHHRALLLSEHASSIGRMPLFLYSSPWEYRFPSADLDAVKSHCLRTGIDAQCSLNDSGSGVVVTRAHNSNPSVTVIIPTRGTEAEVRGKNHVLAAHAIAQLVEHSTFQNFDIVVVVDDDAPQPCR